MADAWTPRLNFNPLLPAFIANPYPTYDRLRREDPLHRGVNGSWCLTRYADVQMVLRDARFGRVGSESRLLEWFGRGPLQRSFSQWMLFKDPPDHTRLRTLVTKAFTPRAVEALRPRIVDIVNALLCPKLSAGRMDVMAELARPLPVLVICELLGIPPEDGARLNEWSDALAAALEMSLATPDSIAAGDAGAHGLTEYFRSLIARRRGDLRDDLLSGLILSEAQGDRLSEDELLATCVIMMFAGHETTINLIGNGLLALLRCPDQLRRLRDNPNLGRSAVEELLRYDSPVQRTGRIALEDVWIDDTLIRCGESVTVVLGAANRDPAQFRDPNRLNVGRCDNHHVSFGGGIHYCVGAPLARLEAQLAFDALLHQMPNLELATSLVEWQESRPNLRGLKALPITWCPT